MAYKYDPETKTWIVWYSKRHPITRIPRRIVRKDIKSEAAAKKLLPELIIELNKRLHKEVVPTWQAALQEFYEYSRDQGIMLNTIQSYQYSLDAHTLSDWGAKCVDEISSQEIRDLINRKVGHRTVHQQKNLLKYIRAVFRMCLEKEYVLRDPTPMIHFPKRESIKGVLKEAEVEQLLNQAKLMSCVWYPIWATALYTGMRSGELFALKWSHVNLDDRTILVNSAWNNKDGFKCTKNGRDRIIPIASNLVPILAELKLSKHDPEFVLPRMRQWEKGEQARELRMFLAGLGLPQVRFHDLRATWATILLSKGIEPIKVMAMGGWSDMKTMMIYIRKAGLDIKGLTNCLNLHNPFAQEGKVLSLSGSR